MAGRPSSSAIRSGSVASADARREAILSELGGRGRVHLAYMAEKLGVSAMTLRMSSSGPVRSMLTAIEKRIRYSGAAS